MQIKIPMRYHHISNKDSIKPNAGKDPERLGHSYTGNGCKTLQTPWKPHTKHEVATALWGVSQREMTIRTAQKLYLNYS